MTTTLNDSPKHQRSKKIELIIVPGRSLGPFRLGTKIKSYAKNK